MSFFDENTPNAPTLDSWVHHFDTSPNAKRDWRAQIRDLGPLFDSQGGALVDKAIDGDKNFLSNIGFAEIKPDLISGAPVAATAADTMTVLVNDGGALKSVSRLDFLQNITGAGEVNTVSNLGDGAGVFFQKADKDFELKSLDVAPGNLTKVETADKITFDIGPSVVKTGGANDFGTFEQTFHSSFLKVANPTDTFKYNIVGGAITDNRAINIPPLGTDDEIAFLAHPAALTNKSINATDNTITNIGDDEIETHTTSKISVTNKALLNSAIVYNDVNNDLGANYVDLGAIGQPPAPASGKTRLYRDNVTNQLTVIDDSNLPASLQASGDNPILSRELAADVPFTDQTVFADVANVGVSVGSNSRYTFMCWFYAQPAGNAIEYGFSGPTSASAFFNVNGGITAFGINSAVALSQASGNRVQLLTGILTTFASPGIFTFRVRHTGTPSSDTVTVRAKTFIQLAKVTQ